MHASPAFSAKLVLVTGTVLVLLAAWQLADLLLLVFAAVLGAILLRALADLLARPTGLASGWSLVLAVVLIALVLALVVVFFGAAILQNIETLVERLPGAWRAVRDRIDSVGWVQAAVDRGTDAMLSGGVVSRIGGALGMRAGIGTTHKAAQRPTTVMKLRLHGCTRKPSRRPPQGHPSRPPRRPSWACSTP